MALTLTTSLQAAAQAAAHEPRVLVEVDGVDGMYRFAAEDLESEYPKIPSPPEVPPWDESGVFDSEEWVIVSHDRSTITRLMWDYVGIVRSNNRLKKADIRCLIMSKDIIDFYRKNPVRSDVIELRNMAITAGLLIKSARMRKESRGLHYNIDHPERDDENFLHDTILKQEEI